MTFNEFLADLKTEFRQYFDANLIDDLLVYKWVNQALKKFGGTVVVRQDYVVSIEDGKGTLPDNFFQLDSAILCDPAVIRIPEGSKPEIINSFFWTDVKLKNKSWDICDSDDCGKKIVEEFSISETTYINEIPVEKYYKNGRELKLAKSFKRNVCSSDCKNQFSYDGRGDVINILGYTMQTNFNEGEVYIRYRGFEQDDEGLTIIPETAKGELQAYVMIFVKKNILEFLLANGEDTNIATLFQYYAQQERSQLALALTEMKFSTLTPKSMYRLKIRPSLERMAFEYNL